MVILIVGNPYSFSVFFEVINNWNTSNTNFNNGVLLLTIDGTVFPREILVSTLSRELWLLCYQLKNIVIQKELFSMEKNCAFMKIYDLVHPKSIDDEYEYSFSITPDSFSDNRYYVFAVGNGDQVRILACNQLKQSTVESGAIENDLIVKDTIISLKEIELLKENIEKAMWTLGIGKQNTGDG